MFAPGALIAAVPPVNPAKLPKLTNAASALRFTPLTDPAALCEKLAPPTLNVAIAGLATDVAAARIVTGKLTAARMFVADDANPVPPNVVDK